jgi:type II secretory pathway component PulF
MALRDMAFSRYCGSFLALLEAGIPMSQCADISHNLCGNAEVASMLAGGAESARAGNAVSDGFSNKLPSDFLSLWHTGEQSGNLSENLQFISEQRQEEAENNLREFGRWMPRICMFIVIFLQGLLILRMRGC